MPVEARSVVGGDGVLPLEAVLALGVQFVGGVWEDVVPGVVGEDVRGGGEVAVAELEGGGAVFWGGGAGGAGGEVGGKGLEWWWW